MQDDLFIFQAGRSESVGRTSKSGRAPGGRAGLTPLTVASPGVADLQVRQVVEEKLEIEGRRRRPESLLLFVQPEKKKKENRKTESVQGTVSEPPPPPRRHENI